MRKENPNALPLPGWVGALLRDRVREDVLGGVWDGGDYDYLSPGSALACGGCAALGCGEGASVESFGSSSSSASSAATSAAVT